MQPVNAQIHAKGMPKILGGGFPDVSRPEAPGVSGLHEMLEVAAQVYVPIGREVSRWIGTGEFSAIAEKWGTSRRFPPPWGGELSPEMCWGSL